MTTTRKVLFTVLLLFLALLITAGLLLFFLKPWAKKKIDTPLGIPVDEHPEFIQVFTLFENQPMINDTTKYTVNKRSHLSSEIYEYCLNEDVLCTQVKFEDDVFWKHSEDSAYGYPKSFTIDVTDKKGSVTFKDHICYYRYDGSEWILYFTAKKDHLILPGTNNDDSSENYFLKKDGDYISHTSDSGHSSKYLRGGGLDSDIKYKDVTVDIAVQNNTDQYGFEELKPGHGQEDCKLFVMKYGYRCSKVKDGLFYNIWTANGNERVSEILLSDRQSPRKIVELVFVDTSRKYFYKPFVLLPWEEFTPK
ncbi:hypothetical protein MACK_003686 [Theileria orientalis]|uniref:Uncharacterized protein n=1 Tax=Theileria orientalis TaxID=68886 RepID=A0A976SJL5_THEOR|nr:hypothetical protein MACK_003686 [Theileria orientalis]